MCIDLFQLMMLLMCNTYPDKEINWKSIFRKSLQIPNSYHDFG